MAEGGERLATGSVFVERLPEPQFRAFVTRIVGYQEAAPSALRQIEPASLAIPLIVSFGAPFRISFGDAAPEDARDFVGGPFAGPVAIGSSGAAACVQIDLTPQGAFRLLGVPLADLRGRLVDPAALIGAEAVRLRDRLSAAPDWPARLHVAECFVRTRLAGAARALPADIGWAYDRLVCSAGRVQVRIVHEEIGWSRRHFTSRFAALVGLRPKEVGRIARLHTALPRIQDRSASLADIAAACGYADQAHMTREMVALAGMTPGVARAG